MSTPVELQRVKEQRLAATREALVRWAHDNEGLCHPWEDHAHCDCSERVNRLLAAAGLRDADEVRREAILHAFKTVRDKHAELRAAITALCDKADRAALAPEVYDPSWRYELPTVSTVDLRALLADDGAAALREHDRQVLLDADNRMFGTTDGDVVCATSEIPTGELRRLLWESFDTAEGVEHTLDDEIAQLGWNDGLPDEDPTP